MTAAFVRGFRRHGVCVGALTSATSATPIEKEMHEKPQASSSFCKIGRGKRNGIITAIEIMDCHVIAGNSG